MDILFFPDVGLSTSSYYLAAHRLAKKQVVAEGHPDTTGLRTMDYYISTKFLQPINAQNNYTEKLIQFNNLTSIFPPLDKMKDVLKKLNRNSFDLPHGKNLYGCLHSLFKIHPEFDDILNEIVCIDPQALFVFTKFPHEPAVRQLKNRWCKNYPKILKHVIFMDRLPFSDFIALLNIIDIHLDTIHFGMGSTAHQVICLKKPIVSWPGKFMRGRFVSSIYDHFKISPSPLVQDKSRYAETAVKWAKDKFLQKAFAKEISAKFEYIFPEKEKILSEYETFFHSIKDRKEKLLH